MSSSLVIEVDAREASDREAPCPSQVFRDPDGQLWMFVRAEVRENTDGWLWVSAKDRDVCTRWTPINEELPGELVNDTACRGEAVVMFLAARAAGQEADRLKRENRALLRVVKDAVRRLPSAQGEELRTLYRRGLTG